MLQSKDWLRNLEIGTQFRDSENAQRNLEIAQIPRLCRTLTPRPVVINLVMYSDRHVLGHQVAVWRSGFRFLYSHGMAF